MDEQQKQMLARMLLGSGMAGNAADMSQYRRAYQAAMMRAQESGQTLPPIEQWVQMQQQQQQQQQLQEQLAKQQPQIPVIQK